MSSIVHRSMLALAVSFVAGCGGGGGAGTPDARPLADATDPGTPDAAPRCGDGLLAAGEACDDGDTDADDGCSAGCAIEAGWACPDPGQACVRIQVCGNGRVEPGEACDDRNAAAGDGCSAACAIEPGWTCPVPGIRCSAAQCGDGIVAGFEECDDGAAATAGCSAGCKLEPGYACPTAGGACQPTTCGDGVPEGTEECDDANHDLGDGCDPRCQREPACANGSCTAVCGDGVLQPGEACDDGNLHDADGCSRACAVEVGFTCTAVSGVEPSTIAATIVLRDFRGFDLPNGHPDFENKNVTDRGMLAPMLGADHKPVYAGNPTTPSTAGAAAFASWYRDAAGINLTYAEPLVLTRTATSTYVYDNAAFFPLDGRGFVGAGTEPTRTNGHNFSFTSEVRYWFQYRGGEVLSFRGDDDVWVFINGRLAVDLGGVHGAENGSVTLTGTTATNLGLAVGGTYEVVVFQAERHTTASSYKLTLKGFDATSSACDDTCGDGITSAYEVCDDGANQGGYGSCTADCLGFGPRCGDGIVDVGHEQCDDGTNAGGYGHCLPTCELGARCGDGIVQTPHETCDDANADPTDGCNACQVVVL